MVGTLCPQNPPDRDFNVSLAVSGERGIRQAIYSVCTPLGKGRERTMPALVRAVAVVCPGWGSSESCKVRLVWSQPTSACSHLHLPDICPADMHDCQLLCRAEDELAGIAALEDAVLEWRNAPRKSKGEQPEWFHPLRSLVQAGIPMVGFSSLADVQLYHLTRNSGAERCVRLHSPHAL